MRKTVITLSLIFITSFAIAQSSSFSMAGPVTWSFSAKKIADKTYEIHFKASVSDPWHIYSQFTPDGGPVPTKLSFNKNPLIKIEGEAKESGRLKQKYEEVFEVDVIYFDGDASFVQVVTLRRAQGDKPIKTNLSGTIEFMACNDEQCLPPATIPFTVLLQ